MILVFGEILFDLFDGHRRLGGAPFNFAFHLKKLGVPVRFFSRVGADAYGREILSFLSRHHFDIRDIQVDSDHATGTVRVTREHDTHHFTITPDTAWDHLTVSPSMADCLSNGPAMIYFGSLVQRTANGRRLVQKVLAEKPAGTRVFCDVNLRPDSHTTAVIQTCLAHADILKLNDEELSFVNETVSTSHAPETDGPIDALSAGPARIAVARHLMAIHRIDTVILTLGSAGSIWVGPNHTVHTPAISPPHVVDTVGAGDAFAAVSAAGMSTGLPPETLMDRAAAFAAQICGQEGALPHDDTIYQDLIPVLSHKGKQP